MKAKIALCASHALPAGELPARLVVLPAGESVNGRDGRRWTVKDRTAILAQIASLNRPLQLDENHASVHRAPKGEPSPACGWLSDFKFGPAGLDAAVEWTDYGAELFSKKAYRYLSPALLHTGSGAKDDTSNVIGLHSVGLTNSPNLDLPALNSTEEQRDMNEEQLKALGLNKDATVEQIAARVAELSKKPEQPAGLDVLATQMKEGFAALLTALKPAAVAPNAAEEAHKIAVNAVLDAAVAAQKVAPAQRAFLASTAKDAAGLAALQAHVETLKPVALNSTDDKLTPPTGGKKFDRDTLKIAAALGCKPEDLEPASR